MRKEKLVGVGFIVLVLTVTGVIYYLFIFEVWGPHIPGMNQDLSNRQSPGQGSCGDFPLLPRDALLVIRPSDT